MPEKRYDRVRLPPQRETERQALPRRENPTKRPHSDPVRRLLRRISGQTLQLKSRQDAFAASPQVEQALHSARGQGQPLPSPARERMESAFGASFEGVTLHTDSAADQLARQVDAVAFTHGRDIYFSAGSFAPESTGGQKLLAHELTHVVQQRAGRKVTVGAAHDPAEAEADDVAEAVVSRLQRQQTHQSLSGQTVARQEEPEEELEPLRRQEEEEEAHPLRRQEEEELAQPLRRQVEGKEQDEEMQLLRRQPESEEETLEPLRRQEEEELALPLRRAPRVTAASAPAAASAVNTQGAQEAPTVEQTDSQQPAAEPETGAGDPLYQQGLAAYHEGDMSQALDCFKQVAASDSASENQRSSAIWNIGRIYQDLGDDKGALEMYRVYLAQPNIPDERRATAQEIVERMERELGPDGGAIEQSGSPQVEAPSEAEAAAPQETPSDPASRVDVLYQQGVQAYRDGELRHAIELWQQVLEIDEASENDRASVIWNLGRVYQDLGNDRAALTMYRTFLAQPSISDERRGVAQGIVEQMERDQATGGVTGESETPAGAKGAETPAALPASPEQRAQALQGLATQAYLSGDYATALEHFQQLMRTDGLAQRVYSETLFNMGQCYRRMGNNAAAINMYRGFIAQPDASPENRARAQQLITMSQH